LEPPDVLVDAEHADAVEAVRVLDQDAWGVTPEK